MTKGELEKHLIEVLATNLRVLRAERGISQDELAALSGLDRTYISGCERAIRNPTIATLAKFATAFDVKAADLLTATIREGKLS